MSTELQRSSAAEQASSPPERPSPSPVETRRSVPKVLELGCGFSKTPGAFGVDIIPGSAADLIHDLDKFPYPLADNEWDHIICLDVLEHVHDFVRTVEEIWRVSRPGALIEVSGPFMSSVNYHTDPTHKRAFTSRSFDYFCPGRELHRYGYSKATFEILGCEYDRGARGHRRGLAKLLTAWANGNKDRYEARFAYIYPMHQINFELRTVK
jgi:SAM-dependent methyltransferase